MEELVETEPARVGKGLIACFVCPFILLLVYGILGWFDTTTLLTPSRENALRNSFVIAGLAGLIWGVLAFRESREMAAWRRAPIACCLTFVAFLAVFLLISRSADLVEGITDFPSSTTTTYRDSHLYIWRAYRTHGKNASWSIQTTPFWSNLDIAESDYKFMLAHRTPGDIGRNPDEIASHGFFCARVTLQQSGSALRVMHAGSQTLPAGTIIVCPSGPSQASPSQP